MAAKNQSPEDVCVGESVVTNKLRTESDVQAISSDKENYVDDLLDLLAEQLEDKQVGEVDTATDVARASNLDKSACMFLFVCNTPQRQNDPNTQAIEDLYSFLATENEDLELCHRPLETLEANLNDLSNMHIAMLWELNTERRDLLPPRIMQGLEHITCHRAVTMSANTLVRVIDACVFAQHMEVATSVFGHLLHIMHGDHLQDLTPGQAVSCLWAGLHSKRRVPALWIDNFETLMIMTSFDDLAQKDVCRVLIFFHTINKRMRPHLQARVDNYLTEHLFLLTPELFYNVMIAWHGGIDHLTTSTRVRDVCQYLDRNITNIKGRDVVTMLSMLAQMRLCPSAAFLRAMEREIPIALVHLNSRDYAKLVWAVCRLNVFIRDIAFVRALLAPLPEKMQNIEKKDLCHIVYSLCIVLAYDHDVGSSCTLVQQAAMQIQLKQFHTSEVCIFHQFVLSLQLRRYPILFTEESRAFCAHCFRERSFISSKTQRDTVKEFRKSGFDVSEEVICPHTSYSIDMRLTTRHSDDVYLVEYDGPMHFVRNLNNVTVHDTGSTLLKAWHMTKLSPSTFARIEYMYSRNQVKKLTRQWLPV
jgi:hypothetical protein